jgi:hypothetical protein
MRGRYSGLDSESIGVPERFDRSKHGALHTLMGVFLGKVVSVKDDTYQNQIYVELIGQEIISDKNEEDRKKYHKVRRLMSFGGNFHDPNYSDDYGMMAPPPSPGSEVLVAFTGLEQEGYLLGVLSDIGRNAQIPGLSAGITKEGVVAPAVDLDVKSTDGIVRTRHNQSEQLAKQGLGLDVIRGLTSSGGRRESPINLFGMQTPGGHSLVMDDGTRNDANVLVPDKARIPGKNDLTRLRTRQGAQILMHDTTGIVYIINQDGSAWIQMSKNGDIDVYSENKISMHCENDMNLHVGGDFNLDAQSITAIARGGGSRGIHLQAMTGEVNILSDKDMNLTSDANGNILVKGHLKVTAKLIDLNGPKAERAFIPNRGNLTQNLTVKQSIANRVPEHEPWGGHAEQDNIVASQAPGKLGATSKDHNISDQKTNAATGSAIGSTQPDPVQIRSRPTGSVNDGTLDPALRAAGFDKTNLAYNKEKGGYVRTDIPGWYTDDAPVTYKSTDPRSPYYNPPNPNTSVGPTQASVDSNINPRTGKPWRNP